MAHVIRVAKDEVEDPVLEFHQSDRDMLRETHLTVTWMLRIGAFMGSAVVTILLGIFLKVG